MARGDKRVALATVLILVSSWTVRAEVKLVDKLADRKLVAPIVINTWNFTSANFRAWQELAMNHSALDAIEFGTGQCEIDRCDGTVGWGGSPAETQVCSESGRSSRSSAR